MSLLEKINLDNNLHILFEIYYLNFNNINIINDNSNCSIKNFFTVTCKCIQKLSNNLKSSDNLIINNIFNYCYNTINHLKKKFNDLIIPNSFYFEHISYKIIKRLIFNLSINKNLNLIESFGKYKIETKEITDDFIHLENIIKDIVNYNKNNTLKITLKENRRKTKCRREVF